MFSLFISQPVFTQNPVLNEKISITADNEKLGDVILRMSNIAQADFSYNTDNISVSKLVSIIAKNRTIGSILDEIIDDPDIYYKVIGNQIIITKKLIADFENNDKEDIVLNVDENNPKEDINENPINAIVSEKETENMNEKDTSIKFDIVDSTFLYESIKIKTDNINTVEYDTIPDQETNTINISNDSLIIDPKEKYSKWSTDIFFASMRTSWYIKALNLENSSMVELIQNAEKPALSYSIGGNINYNYKNVAIQTGISYTQFRINANYNFHNIDIDTITSYDVTSNSYWDVYTIDSFFQTNGIDTTWKHVIDSNFVTTYDSTEITDFDTSKTVSSYDNLNTYSYIEIPLVLSYSFKRKKVSYALKGGLIAGLFLRSTGMTISTTNELIETKSLPFIKTNFSLYFACNFDYHINNKISIMLEPFYRQSLNSVFNKNYKISLKPHSVGLRVGLRYYFN